MALKEVTPEEFRKSSQPVVTLTGSGISFTRALMCQWAGEAKRVRMYVDDEKHRIAFRPDTDSYQGFALYRTKTGSGRVDLSKVFKAWGVEVKGARTVPHEIDEELLYVSLDKIAR